MKKAEEEVDSQDVAPINNNEIVTWSRSVSHGPDLARWYINFKLRILKTHAWSIIPIILHKTVCLSVCRRLQTAGRNSCSTVSGDVSN